MVIKKVCLVNDSMSVMESNIIMCLLSTQILALDVTDMRYGF